MFSYGENLICTLQWNLLCAVFPQTLLCFQRYFGNFDTFVYYKFIYTKMEVVLLDFKLFDFIIVR